MRHARLVVHRLLVEGVEVPVRFATLMVVAREESDRPDWEVVAESTTEVSFDLRRHGLAITAVTGADDDGRLELSELAGDGAVVRFVDNTVVFRGDGPLDGLDEAWLV